MKRFALVLLAVACQPKTRPSEEAEAIYASTCARCHGEDGMGGKPLYDGGPGPRKFVDAEFQASRTDEMIFETITKGRPGGMPPFGATFSKDQIEALVAKVRSFDPRGNR